MALVAAGVANEGVVMEPKLVERIVAPDGDVIQRFEPEEWTTAVEPSTAADLTAMMELAVQSGTGVAAQIPGISVAGKTGTAETGSQGGTTPGSSPSRPPTARRSPSQSPSPIRRAPAARRRPRSRAPSSRRPSGEMPNL